MKIKNTSRRYNINRPWSTHEHKFSKYKKWLTVIMLICGTQQLSKI